MLNVGVIFHDNTDLIEPFFYFLRRSTHVPYRVIVIDNGQRDGTKHNLKNILEKDDITIYPGKNVGVAVARNLILTAALKYNKSIYPPIAFLDSDLFIVRDGSLDRMLNRTKEHGIIFGHVHSFHDWKTTNTGICFSLFSENFFNVVGRFDERFFCFYDDTDIMRRAQKAQMRWCAEQTAIGIHAWGSTLWKHGRTGETSNILKNDNKKYNEKWQTQLAWDA